ncbi:MAG: hypothetical protein M1826_001601 [Phylliscum demangeonii]|nr:MAG: hypothetical protein M1826_001601 [Phylliscum demangeonii]
MPPIRPWQPLRALPAPSLAKRWPTSAHARFVQSKNASEPPPVSSSEPPEPRPGESALVREEGASSGMAHHHPPNYDAPIDFATSQFSPVARRVMDGSEAGDVLPAAVLSGAPVELQARTVRISRPSKTATQSGDWHAHEWRMDWDILGKGHRWENELMGWQSTADFMSSTHLSFKTKEDAIRFAEKQGYEYFVQEHNDRRFVPKAYANNFLYSKGKLKVVRTK